jgi:hypothetical protein
MATVLLGPKLSVRYCAAGAVSLLRISELFADFVGAEFVRLSGCLKAGVLRRQR